MDAMSRNEKLKDPKTLAEARSRVDGCPTDPPLVLPPDAVYSAMMILACGVIGLGLLALALLIAVTP